MIQKTYHPTRANEISITNGNLWTFDSYALSLDGNYAITSSMEPGGISNLLQVTGFKDADGAYPAVPEDATIKNAYISVHRRASVEAGMIVDNSIRLTAGGNQLGDDMAVDAIWPTTVAEFVYGGEFGGLLTPANINDRTLSIDVQAQCVSTTQGVQAEIDYVELVVQYEEANADAELTPLEAAQAKLVLWQTALDEIATQGQSYVIKSTTLNRADLDKCLKMVRYYQSEVSRLTAGRGAGARVIQVIPRDI